MFAKFLHQHSFSEYQFRSDFFPSVNDRAFWETFQNEDCSVTEVLMSILPVRVEDGAAVIGERYRVRADGCTIATEFLPFEDKRLESDWHTDGVTRITLSAENTDEIVLSVEKTERKES